MATIGAASDILCGDLARRCTVEDISTLDRIIAGTATGGNPPIFSLAAKLPAEKVHLRGVTLMKENGPNVVSEDIVHPTTFTWVPSDPKGSAASINGWLEDYAQAAVHWYRAERLPAKRWSKTIRIVTMVTLAVGALCPLLSGMLDGGGLRWMDRLGYVFFAISAGVYGVDRGFGFSTAWVRYINADVALTGILNQYRHEWAKTLHLTDFDAPNDVAALIAVAQSHAGRMDAVMQNETTSWAQEFQSHIADLSTVVGSAGDTVV